MIELREGTGTQRHLINGARQHGSDFEIILLHTSGLIAPARLMETSGTSKKHPFHFTSKRGEGNGQRYQRVANTVELIGAGRHFQFSNAFSSCCDRNHGQTGFTGDPQHTGQPVGLQNPLRRLVDI